ncbi:MAG: 2-amino-4-hydroxy-6-hydroxymethyldihydropteridine diphosphokinase [Anaerolineae bacterium]|nr:2-amino-4-hydroxy-6-hydroxymethyldihydropteridine diphosphokinase [Anaerolineae bacterium]
MGNKLERHEAYLSLGSNINPEHNLPEAIRLLAKYGQVQSASSAWKSAPVGAAGPDFLNAALLFSSRFEFHPLRREVLRPIEAQLGRERGPDKNAPRPIDIDIMIFDNKIHDPEIWSQAHLALPLAEILPNLCHPESGQTIAAIADKLQGLGEITRQGLHLWP